MSDMTYVRMFTGPDGESHFEDVAVGFTSTTFAPPAPPIGVSGWYSADRVGFLSFPPGWRGEPHPTPRRQFMVLLAGSVGGQTSDGEIRHLHAGDVILMEDTTGKGHSSWNAGDDTLVVATIQLAP